MASCSWFLCGLPAKSAAKTEVTESSQTVDPELSSITAVRKAIKALIAKAQALDLCFLLDATGSMKKSIDMVKTKVAEVVGGIKAEYPECDLRLSIVLYRDYDDHDQDMDGKNENCDFTKDFNGPKSTFMKSLLSVHVKGGNDYVEDVFTGLQRVANLDWQAPSRLLVHICDAPCHGTRFHDLPEKDSDERLNDRFPQGDKYGRDIADLLQRLRGQCEVNQYFFCHLTDWTKKMIGEFKRVTGENDWIKDMRFEDINTIPQTVVSISCSTISQTISTSRTSLNTYNHHFKSGGYQFIPETVVKKRPDWAKIRELEGQLHKHKWYSSLEELLTKIKKRQPIEFEQTDPIALKIAPNPFSNEGALRWPYHALVPQLHSKYMVAKRFKMHPRSRGNSPAADSKKRYASQMEVQTVAAQMAHEFNERSRTFGHENLKRLEFLTVFTLYANFKWYNLENYLEGTWIKYSNNAGYVNSQWEDYATTLQAFTHWTYERSDGELMVTDLQGVSQPTSDSGSYMFWLCDPAIHCRDLMRFTNTNLGTDGFSRFFRTHKCSDLCGLLSLEPRTHSDKTVLSTVEE